MLFTHHKQITTLIYFRSYTDWTYESFHQLTICYKEQTTVFTSRKTRHKNSKEYDWVVYRAEEMIPCKKRKVFLSVSNILHLSSMNSNISLWIPLRGIDKCVVLNVWRKSCRQKCLRRLELAGLGSIEFASGFFLGGWMSQWTNGVLLLFLKVCVKTVFLLFWVDSI